MFFSICLKKDRAYRLRGVIQRVVELFLETVTLIESYICLPSPKWQLILTHKTGYNPSPKSTVTPAVKLVKSQKNDRKITSSIFQLKTLQEYMTIN